MTRLKVSLVCDFLLVIIELFSLDPFVLSQYTHLTDGRTDGQTDRKSITIACVTASQSHAKNEFCRLCTRWNHCIYNLLCNDVCNCLWAVAFMDCSIFSRRDIVRAKTTDVMLKLRMRWSQQKSASVGSLSLIHIWRCRRSTLCRSRWSPYH